MRLKILRKTAINCSALAILLVNILSVVHIYSGILPAQETCLSNASSYFSIPSSDHTPTTHPLTALELEEDEEDDEEAENNHCNFCRNKTRIFSNKDFLAGYIDSYTLLKKRKSLLYFSDSSPPTRSI